MVREIRNRLYKINTYASSMILEIDNNYDEKVKELKQDLKLESLGCRLNLLAVLADMSVKGCVISSVTEFNVDGSKPKVAYASDKDYKKIVKYLMERNKRLI